MLSLALGKIENPQIIFHLSSFFLCPGMASRGHGGGFDHRLASPRFPAHATVRLLHFFPPALMAVDCQRTARFNLDSCIKYSNVPIFVWENTGDFFGVNRCDPLRCDIVHALLKRSGSPEEVASRKSFFQPFFPAEETDPRIFSSLFMIRGTITRSDRSVCAG